jgi:hypothetical protein
MIVRLTDSHDSQFLRDILRPRRALELSHGQDPTRTSAQGAGVSIQNDAGPPQGLAARSHVICTQSC